MTATLQFELVSPEHLLLSKKVALVTVPGGEGEYGVLPGHVPMVTTVKAGVIQTYAEENGAPTDRIFVAGGFAEVTQDRCTVLADEATPVSELKPVDIQNALADIGRKIDAAEEEDRATLESAQQVLQAKLQAAA